MTDFHDESAEELRKLEREEREDAMKTPQHFDTKCYDLAAAFLEDEPELNTEQIRNELAGDIQQCIEDYIEFKKTPRCVHGSTSGNCDICTQDPA